MSTDNCTLQYYYPTQELTDKYKINCTDKKFLEFQNIKKFNNEEFLNFVNEKYNNVAFNGDSPFTFKQDYINQTNEQICKVDDFSLKPQQKFVGQFINPATNFNNTLVFHGLGSGKTCTALVIAEAFKITSSKKILFVVPAPLIDQYKEEILGELKNIKDENVIWSCTSQCVINGERDFYSNVADKSLLQFFELDYEEKTVQLNNLNIEINKRLKERENVSELKKDFSSLQNEVNTARAKLKTFREQLFGNIQKVFQIESHIVFINKLFKVTADGTWVKQEHLTDKNSALLNTNGVLIIDEIQRLVSAGGILYKKLFTAIYQYVNPGTRIIILTATPIYDNPYELALTMNLLRPRMPFPLSREVFYSFFLGKYNEEDTCTRIKTKNFITENSCLINSDLLKLLLSGYISYFRGGNPNAYPYKRIITLEHKMSATQKEFYIDALKSDIKKDNSAFSKYLNEDEMVFKQSDFDSNQKDDSVSGIYVTTQQFSNIALPMIKSDVVDNIISKKAKSTIKTGLKTLKDELKKLKSNNPETVLNYIRGKGYSQKFISIINLSLHCNGPVFIFSNWLQFGVESLSIILDACGFVKYPNQGINRYFVWSSETSIDKPLINKAKSTFNSMDNSDGSLLKIILGTRSIMEGVSFKNVKQVHITDPWWNEARIEQILARAVRFCSHSNLPLREQYTDIFRHYTVLPMAPDLDIVSMLEDTIGQKKFKNFENLTIEQKMLMSALKKFQINNEFEDTLKEVAYDCDLNEKGNLIRLEEHVRPLSNGKFQIYFRNPKTLINYIREGIPKDISFEQIMTREYSYPNDDKLPVIFYQGDIKDDYLVKMESEEVLKEPEINKNLIMFENIKCWKNPLTLEKIFEDLFLTEANRDIVAYFIRIYENFNLYPLLRTKILGEIKVGTRIQFTNDSRRIRGKHSLLSCLKKISEYELTPVAQKIKIKNLLLSSEAKDKNNSKIIDIVYTYNFLPEDKIEELQELDSRSLDEIFKEAKVYHERGA